MPLLKGKRIKLQQFTLDKKDWIDREVVKEYSTVSSHGIQADEKVYIRDCRHQTCNIASAAKITEETPAVMNKKKGVSRQGDSEPPPETAARGTSATYDVKDFEPAVGGCQ